MTQDCTQCGITLEWEPEQEEWQAPDGSIGCDEGGSHVVADPGAAFPIEDGYEGVTHAGLAVVRHDGPPSVLLAQRAFDEDDDPAVQETWEFPGGGLEDGEDPQTGAIREFEEESGFPLPPGEVIGGWRSDDGVYQGFVYHATAFVGLGEFKPNDEVQALGWYTREMIDSLGDALRPEVRNTDWDLIFGPVSGNEADMDDETAEIAEVEDYEPEYTPGTFDLVNPIPVHGIVAPEEVRSGDLRGFAAGSMTRRPLRLPFSDQKVAIGGHDGSVVVGSVDRLMRKDGMIHWEGSLMPSPEADDLVARMQFFGGRFGVSVDGDQGGIDTKRTTAEEVLWFDQIRASGLTAVAIPAFHEAFVGFGLNTDMPSEDSLVASAYDEGNLIGARAHTFDRGPGWVTNPKETKTLHTYWTVKGEPGYAKVGWGTPGDFTRAKALIGEKIAKNSPEKMKYLNQIIAQWHFDALGYWPGELGKPGNAPDTPENRQRAARHAASGETIEMSAEEMAEARKSEREEAQPLVEQVTESIWEAVLVSSALGKRALPHSSYFDRHPETDALTIDDPDEFGLRRVYGYAGEWGVCHIGYDGRCVEVPEDPDGGTFPDFHLGYTRTSDAGKIHTGLLTYNVEHRDAQTILTEGPTQSHFDNLKNAWASVRIGQDDRGIWFSGVVLPKVDEDDLTKIEASGQVSGEWKYGALRALLTINVPGFGVRRSTAEHDANGNLLALSASMTNLGGCEPTTEERFAALRQIDAEVRFAALKRQYAIEGV